VLPADIAEISAVEIAEISAVEIAEISAVDIAENPHAGQGMVVLDIGGDIGALIVTAPAELAGAEIEICPSGAREQVPDEGAQWWQGAWRSHGAADDSHGHDHSHDDSHDHSHDDAHDHSHDDAHPHDHHAGPAWPHVAVLGRPTGAGIAFGAVYPGLRAGRYDLWLREGGPIALTVTVQGAQVTSIDWPSPDSQPDRLGG
jgi:hypothetical protein